MFSKHDISRNVCQLFGGQAKCGYDWWRFIFCRSCYDYGIYVCFGCGKAVGR